jgi:glycosyltransferase involved in cell wall biosynthesis
MQRSIAFFCHPYHRGGVTRWMADAALAYDRKGWSVYFVVPEPSVEFYSGKGRETMVQLLTKKPNGIKVISCKVGREFEFGTPQYQGYIYRRLLAQLPASTPIILSDDKTVWQSAVDLHKSYPLVGVLHADEDAYYTLAKRFHKEVDIFVCVSDKVNRTVKTKVPEIAADRIFTVPCGIEFPSAAFKPKAGSKLKLMYAGRITAYQKRAGDLLKVASLLNAKGIDYHWDIIGDGGDYKISLEQQFKTEGLLDKVVFRGWLSQAEVQQYMADADVLVLVSDFEGMPVAMMEALSMGCGFVGTRVSGIEDYEFHPLAKDCFGVFDVGYIEEAVTRIQQIAAVPVSTRQASARQLAESQFTMDICLDNYNKAMNTIPAKQYTAPSKASISPIDALKSRLTAMARSAKMAMK